MGKNTFSNFLDSLRPKSGVNQSTPPTSQVPAPPSPNLSQTINQAPVGRLTLERNELIDAKTGLFNEAPFKEAESKAIESIEKGSSLQPIIEIYMDIDNFRLFNEDFGFEAGDDTLTKVGMAILSNISKTDIAGRVGGEELAVITTKSSNSVQNPLAEVLRRAIQDQQLNTGRPVTVSVGVAEHTRGEDINLYKLRLLAAETVAKKNGKNRVVEAILIDGKEEYRDWASNKIYSVKRNERNEITEINEVING